MNQPAMTIDTDNSDTPAAILVVDDNEMNRDMLLRRLRPMGFRVETATDGAEALDALQREPYDLVLLDIMMPVMDGFEVLKCMKQDNTLRTVPVIMITALDDSSSAARCIDMGAEDYLTKPFDPTLLKARVGACLERKRLHDKEAHYRTQIEMYNSQLQERVQQQVQEISQAQLGAIFAMSKLAESRDPETGEHLERMREYCRILSQQLSRLTKYQEKIDAAFISDIYAASPLHDIGKVGIDDSVLLKPGKLTADEWQVMRLHPVIGAETLKEVDKQHPGNTLIRMGVEIASAHHERWDGGGYPYGLRGEEIPLVARILALGDVYDALTSKRCYKDAFSHEKSRGILVEGSGNHFDPEVVDAFIATEDEFKRVREYFQDSE
ncbi:MAG: response regulator [Gammaproteobacteria bacterium]|nr:response regulator [Gammaproteobacteria bacterium]MDH5799745.1 response regulator [Gammaproteobacteria bacterium]